MTDGPPEVARIAVLALFALGIGNLLTVVVFFTAAASRVVVVLWVGMALVSTVWGLFAQSKLRKLIPRSTDHPEGTGI